MCRASNVADVAPTRDPDPADEPHPQATDLDATDLDADDVDADDVDADDEEALRWAGDDEAGRDAPRLRADRAKAAADGAAPGDDSEPRRPGDTARAAAAAVFALPYLAWTIGWILAVTQMSSGASQLLGEIIWQFGEFLAILAAPLWFAATLTLTRDAPPRVRVGVLALGSGVLVPWPLVLQFLAALSFAGSIS